MRTVCTALLVLALGALALGCNPIKEKGAGNHGDGEAKSQSNLKLSPEEEPAPVAQIKPGFKMQPSKPAQVDQEIKQDAKPEKAPLRLEIISAKITQGVSFGYGGSPDLVTRDQLFQIQILASNISSSKLITLPPLERCDIYLTDNFGNKYDLLKNKFRLQRSKPYDIYPEKTAKDVLHFKRPIDLFCQLALKINCSGHEFEFEIKKDSILHFPDGDPNPFTSDAYIDLPGSEEIKTLMQSYATKAIKITEDAIKSNEEAIQKQDQLIRLSKGKPSENVTQMMQSYLNFNRRLSEGFIHHTPVIAPLNNGVVGSLQFQVLVEDIIDGKSFIGTVIIHNRSYVGVKNKIIFVGFDTKKLRIGEYCETPGAFVFFDRNPTDNSSDERMVAVYVDNNSLRSIAEATMKFQKLSGN